MTATKPPVGGALLTIIRKAAHTCLLAAPYIKTSALQRVFEQLADDVRLTVVTRWIPHDIMAGASDPEAWLLTTQRGGVFLNHPHLHAKYYRADHFILIGSANLTDTALGWAELPNLEILCDPGSEFDASIFEADMLSGAVPIGESQYTVFEALPRRPRSAQHHVPETGSLPDLTLYRPYTHSLNVLYQAYQSGTTSDNVSADLAGNIRRDLAALAIPPNLTLDEYRAFLRARLTACPFVVLVKQSHFPQMPELEITYLRIVDRLQENSYELRNHVANAVQWIIWLA